MSSLPSTLQLSTVATPPPSKTLKREFSHVEVSPDFNQKLNDETNRIRALIEDSYERVSAKFENVLSQLYDNATINMETTKGLLSELKKVINEISQIKEVNVKTAKVLASIKTNQSEISARVNYLEQERLNNSIEISGLNPATMKSQKSAHEIASQVLSIYKVNSFQSAYKRQVTIRSEPKNFLVVTFKSYEDKMKALDQKRTTDLGKKCSVYFNHSLTAVTRSLYMRARIAAKSLNLKAAISYGRIFIRKPNEKFGHRIQTEMDLERFIANNGTK